MDHQHTPTRQSDTAGHTARLFLRRWPLFLMIAFVLLISCTFVRWSISESFAHGRLASEPNYDDVTYLYSGARILQSVRAGSMSSKP